MIETKMQPDAFANGLVECRRQSQSSIVYIYRLVSLRGNAKSQDRSLARFHLDRKFGAPRTGRHRAAEGIEKSFRGIQVTSTHRRAQKRQWLCEGYLIGRAVVLCFISVCQIATTEDFTLACGPRQLKRATPRQGLFDIDASDEEIRFSSFTLKGR